MVVVGLELFGIGTLFYGLATVAEFFVSGQLSGLLEERRTQRMIDSYSDHFIICGFGRVGRQVARDLRPAGRQSRHDRQRTRATARPPSTMGVRYIESYAADDEVLLKAGIERARAVIACVDSDAENIFIALTARGLRSDILIIARASAEDSEKKLLRAGADRVISPYKTSGSEMARVALHPQVGGAMQVADYRMEEIEVPPSCEGVGKTIEQVRGESVIVAVRRADGRLEPQPAPQSVIEAGDMLVAIGTPECARAAGDRVPAAGGAEHVTPPLARAARRGRRGRGVTCAATASRPRRRASSAPSATGQGDYSTNVAMLLAPSLGVAAARDRRARRRLAGGRPGRRADPLRGGRAPAS